MTLSVDLFYSYRSPYSYLYLPRTMQFVVKYDLTLDSRRVAQRENIPYGFPRPDPIVQDLMTLEIAAMDAAISADPVRYEKIIAGNEQDHANSGHRGVPTFVFENEPFFGQDRIDLLVWHMESRGLTRRK